MTAKPLLRWGESAMIWSAITSLRNKATHAVERLRHNMGEAGPSFERTYPSIAKWVKSYGWIEIGQLDWHRDAMVRALDEGGMVWEGKAEYATLDDLWRDLEGGLAGWFTENGEQETR